MLKILLIKQTGVFIWQIVFIQISLLQKEKMVDI
jgi:hypothetical protein